MKKGIHILLGMLLLVLPITAQDSIPMAAEQAGWLRDENVAPEANPVAGQGMVFEEAEMLHIEEKPQQKQVIDARVVYSSSDSLMMTGKGIAHMYGSGEVKYKALELTADYIRVCMDSSTLYASGVLDTIEDEWVGLPVFKDASQSYESKEITYNLKTQKGKIRHVVTDQGEGVLIAEETKKMDDNTLMMHGGKYTTCDDHDHPHFYLQMTKGKVQPKKNVVFGPAYLVVGEVPLPLAVPFGFFPFTDKYSSGLIMPNFGDDYTRGMYLQGLGYYFAINDYVDLHVKVVRYGDKNDN